MRQPGQLQFSFFMALVPTSISVLGLVQVIIDSTDQALLI